MKIKALTFFFCTIWNLQASRMAILRVLSVSCLNQTNCQDIVSSSQHGSGKYPPCSCTVELQQKSKQTGLVMLFSFSCSLPKQPLPKFCGPPEVGEATDPITIHCQVHVFCFQMNRSVQNILMAPFPKPEFLGDYESPNNVMVAFPSRKVYQGLGDCQAVPIRGGMGNKGSVFHCL